jgi:ABC-2 type transport system ATP-binding protein
MIISASHLTKKYPGRVAVEDISFDVGHREVVGFLGPNGSGKTTTLRMLCGYLPATGGTARVAGYDVHRHAMEVRARVGYLPENCPLYPDMRVDEYLHFRAALKGVPSRQVKRRVQEVRDLCGLGDAGRRIIGHLSKGYRQRVGLSEAMVHDPELLILDEPTIGLDPNQIRQVRQLIRELGERHTILLSTHILSEVEAICRRVLIIKDGRIVASDDTDQLIRHMKGPARFHIEIKAPRLELEAELARWPEIHSDTVESDDAWLHVTLTAPRPHDPREQMFARAAAKGWTVRELHREPGTLEELFVALTDSPPSPREFTGYFLSPVAYAILAFFLLVTGLIFHFLTGILAGGVSGIGVMNLMFGSPLYWMTLLVVVPVLTMRLFAEERRMGTLETLLTAPISDAAVVGAKFAAVYSFFILMWMPTLLFLGALQFLSAEAPVLDAGHVAAGYFGALLSGAMFLSIGLLCSITTSNQMVAAITCFAVLILIFLIGFADYVTYHEGFIAMAFILSPHQHMLEFSRGVIDTRAVVLYASGTLFFLFTATRILEARQWK